jgi:hypothetical protein
MDPIRKDVLIAAKNALFMLSKENNPLQEQLANWKNNYETTQRNNYTSHLHSQSVNQH